MDESANPRRPPGSPLRLGDTVASKYRIEREVGRGGMGIVFAARHMTLDRLVAIKVMKHELLEDPRAVKRLLFEAKSAAKIQSEHVSRVLDVGTLPDGVPYIVMEYLDGQDLGALIDRSGPMGVEQAVRFVLQACEALSEVHVANLVHRDLKPGNLFIARQADGSPAMKIVDFGISKYVGGPGGKLAKTTSPHVLGSPFYMAPEQMRADSVDARSDIWALGAILFEMLTGRTPFTGETLPEVYAAVLGDPPPPISELRGDVPPPIDDIIQCCLEKSAANRFDDVAALAVALAPYGGPPAQQSVERITRVLRNASGAMQGAESEGPGPSTQSARGSSPEMSLPPRRGSTSPAASLSGASPPVPSSGSPRRGVRAAMASSSASAPFAPVAVGSAPVASAAYSQPGFSVRETVAPSTAPDGTPEIYAEDDPDEMLPGVAPSGEFVAVSSEEQRALEGAPQSGAPRSVGAALRRAKKGAVLVALAAIVGASAVWVLFEEEGVPRGQLVPGPSRVPSRGASQAVRGLSAASDRPVDSAAGRAVEGGAAEQASQGAGDGAQEPPGGGGEKQSQTGRSGRSAIGASEPGGVSSSAGLPDEAPAKEAAEAEPRRPRVAPVAQPRAVPVAPQARGGSPKAASPGVASAEESAPARRAAPASATPPAGASQGSVVASQGDEAEPPSRDRVKKDYWDPGVFGSRH